MKMSMKSIVSLSCAVVAMATACSTDEMSFVNNVKPSEELAFEASFANEDETKSFFDTEGNYTFSAGDSLSIFNGENNYKFVCNETGTSVTFYGEAPAEENYNVLYPYQASATCTSTGVITAYLPSVQYATVKTYDPAAFLSVAKINSSKGFSLQHACGRIAFTAIERFSSVTLKGNNNEDLAGNVNITVSNTPTALLSSNTSKTIEIKAASGTASPGMYYITIAPQSFTNGITLTLKRENGSTIEKIINTSFAVGRGKRVNAGNLGEDAPDYLKFTANEASTIAMSGNAEYVNIEYSTDATRWDQWDLSAISLSAGQSVYFRGDNETTGFSNTTANYYSFVMNGSLNASGDVMSLIYGASDGYFTKRKIIPNPYCFYKLFAGCDALQTTPDMPATTLTANCYNSMYLNCTSIKSAVLPATELVNNCYTSMFEGCTALESLEVGFTKETYLEKVNKKYFYTSKWLYNASPSGTMLINLDKALVSSNVNTVPSGWSITSY